MTSLLTEGENGAVKNKKKQACFSSTPHYDLRESNPADGDPLQTVLKNWRNSIYKIV